MDKPEKPGQVVQGFYRYNMAVSARGSDRQQREWLTCTQAALDYHQRGSYPQTYVRANLSCATRGYVKSGASFMTGKRTVISRATWLSLLIFTRLVYAARCTAAIHKTKSVSSKSEV
ncbi:hypothetical protein IG631_10245 [Alternaria alternata]|jgi:hypothetical protein|nr:hypothetical protein IG631_10245 [Alternaria alternata]